jgi:hypothetical protein
MFRVLANLKGRFVMSVLTKRNLLIAIAIFVIGAATAIWAVPRIMKRGTSINSQVTAFLLDDRGAVNGLLLASGDQLRFSPETSAAVASQIKVGDQVSAAGHAGKPSKYGREVRVESISANGQTIVEANAGPRHAHGPRDRRGPRGGDDREESGPPRERGERGRDVSGPDTKPAEPNSERPDESRANPAVSPSPGIESTPAPASTPEIFKAMGTVKTHLVNGRGDVDGLILSSGEQVQLSPRVGQLVIAAEQGSNLQITVEGTGVRNEHGTVIRPQQLVVGNQTIVLGRRW